MATNKEIIQPKTVGSQAEQLTVQRDLHNQTINYNYNIVLAGDPEKIMMDMSLGKVSSSKDTPSSTAGSSKGAPPSTAGSSKGTPPSTAGSSKGTPPSTAGSSKGTPSSTAGSPPENTAVSPPRRETIKEELEKLEKTPVVYLDEICKVHKWKLNKFDKSSSGPPFKFSFSVDVESTTYKGSGEGVNKKLAKEDAAYDLLEHLPNKLLGFFGTATPKPIKETTKPPSPSSHSQNQPQSSTVSGQSSGAKDVNMSYVQDLNVYCSKRGLSPTYQDAGQEGQPHSPTFTVRYNVTTIEPNENLVTHGEASTKMEARQIAASKMMDQLVSKFSS